MKLLSTFAVAFSLSLASGSAFSVQVSAPFTDSGQYRHTFLGDGSSHESTHVELANVHNSISHQAGQTGNESGVFFGTAFTHSRRAYYAFDLSDVTDNVTAATFRVWGWAPHSANSSTGVYTSQDASETLQLRSLDEFTASEIVDAPYQDLNNHTLDVPIWKDLADGDIYGSRVFTLADEQNPGLIASPTAASPDCSDPSANACGRWFDIELTGEALADINAANDGWAFGAIVSTIDGTGAQELFAGNVVDFNDTDSSFYPAFTTPTPELLLTTSPVPVPVPAAAWLFGTALAGLAGVKRKRMM